MLEHPIYQPFTRAKLIKGVPRDFALMSMILSAVGIEILTFFGYEPMLCYLGGFFSFAVLWMVGWLLAKRDPEFLTVFIMKRTKIGTTKSVEKYNGNRYTV